ncbi:MAG: helix-turn-helix domain-containing protein [Actinomycetota bacterium]
MGDHAHHRTADVAPAERWAYWSDQICASLLQLAVERGPSDELDADLWVDRVGGLRFAGVRAQPHRVRRTPTTIRRDPSDEIAFAHVVSGRGRLHQAGRALELEPGVGAFYDTMQPYAFEMTAAFALDVVLVSRDRLERRAGPLSDVWVRRLDGATASLRVVRAVLAELVDPGDRSAPSDERRHLASGAVDALAAAAVSISPDAAAANDGSTRLRRAALDLVEQRLGDPDLTPAVVARELAVSVRTLHAAFSGTGTTVAARMRRRRIETAAELLGGRHPPSVAATAALVGFRRADVFGRAFRSELGESPARYRERMR